MMPSPPRKIGDNVELRKMDADNVMNIRGRSHLLGDGINTDIHCSSKYLPGKDNAYIAQHAFEQLVPEFPSRFKAGDVIVAGKNFGINSSREQAVHVMRGMGVAAIVATSFARQFFRNCINNGLPAVECDISGIAQGDEIEIDIGAGRVVVPGREIERGVAALPAEVQAILAAGGLIAFLKSHPDWKLVPVTSDR
jgi:3-isopropylmalate dehydratase small subunit